MGATAKTNPYTYLDLTISVCPTCHRSLPATLSQRDGCIYMSKTCPEHGRFRSLVASDSALYLQARQQTSPSYLLGHHQTKVERGCPQDCGVCPEHEQNNAAPVIEITNACNLDCPICFAGQKHDYFMSSEEMDRCLDIIEASGTRVDVLIVTGGEPTAHPKLLELIATAQKRAFIPLVAVATNGIQIAKRDELCKGLAELGVFVLLQLDSKDPEKNQALRGKEMVQLRERAMAQLAAHSVPTTVLMTVVAGLNHDELGSLMRYALSHEFVGGFEAQTMAYTGVGGRSLSFDPKKRLTGTDLLLLMEAQSDGLLGRDDFLPMPHPHPTCINVAYLLRLDSGELVSFARFCDRETYRGAILGHFIAQPDDSHEELLRQMIDRVWSDKGNIDHSTELLETLTRLVDELYPEKGRLSDADRAAVVQRSVRNVFLHNVMDDHCLDAAVLRKCTSMQVLPDGRMIPHCSYRVLHRATDPRFAHHGGAQLGHGLDDLRLRAAREAE